VSIPVSALAQPTAVGGEFLVNTYTTGPQRFPSACALGGGDFVVAWEDGRANYFGLNDGADGSETCTVARKIGPSGDFDFLVNTYTTGRQGAPSSACLDDGGFVVVWSELETYFGATKQGHFAVAGRRYDDTAQPGAPFTVEEQDDPGQFAEPEEGSSCRAPGGGFVVVWNSATSFSEPTTVRRFNAQGVQQGTDVELPNVNNPKCCGSDDGFVVIGWQGGGTGTPEILGQRFAADGALAGTQFTANTWTTGRQSLPSVACNARGEFVVVWESSNVGLGGGSPQDGDGYGVFGQRFGADGSRAGTEFQVNVYTTQNQQRPAVAMDRGGRFVVAWTNYSYDDVLDVEDDDIAARAFDDAGAPLGTEFQVNSYTTEPASDPAVAIEPGGDLLIVWHTTNDGDDHSISGQRYSLGSLPPTTTTTVTTTTLTATTSTTNPTSTTTLPAGQACGDPVAFVLGNPPPDNTVTATDALFALKAAVGSGSCALCICDVDNSGGVTATDALIILKLAVGQPVTVNCVACL